MAGGALENQAVGPVLSAKEMAHDARTWAQATTRLAGSRPLAMATDHTPDVAAALQSNPTYPLLFAAAFGDDQITAQRIAFALATYQRSLVSDQTPWDRFQAGDTAALTAAPTAACPAPRLSPAFRPWPALPAPALPAARGKFAFQHRG